MVDRSEPILVLAKLNWALALTSYVVCGLAGMTAITTLNIQKQETKQ